jgi:hypothetical protein
MKTEQQKKPSERFELEGTILSLEFALEKPSIKNRRQKLAIKSSDKKWRQKVAIKQSQRKHKPTGIRFWH